MGALITVGAQATSSAATTMNAKYTINHQAPTRNATALVAPWSSRLLSHSSKALAVARHGAMCSAASTVCTHLEQQPSIGARTAVNEPTSQIDKTATVGTAAVVAHAQHALTTMDPPRTVSKPKDTAFAVKEVSAETSFTQAETSFADGAATSISKGECTGAQAPLIPAGLIHTSHLLPADCTRLSRQQRKTCSAKTLPALGHRMLGAWCRLLLVHTLAARVGCTKAATGLINKPHADTEGC